MVLQPVLCPTICRHTQTRYCNMSKKRTNMDRFGIECIGDFEPVREVLLVHFKNGKKRKAFIDWLEAKEE